MGGRGASLGEYHLHGKQMKYGDEYKTLLKTSNVKFVVRKDGKNATAPRETMTRGRVYVTVDNDEKTLLHITYFDNDLKRKKQIDLAHNHKGIMPHTHVGYDHDEGGTKHLSTEEKAMVDFVRKTWQDKNNK